MEDSEKAICQEYQYLLLKSHGLFVGLRELPQVGQRHWQKHFQETFECYTRLWKYQQQHRSILEKKEFGLNRWEIGEIASKIGQLYYHYYWRTSDTDYLRESYVFYSAIHTRGYLKNMEPKTPLLISRKLRYYARFVVVCLLLNHRDMASELIEELSELVSAHAGLLNDVGQWQSILKEFQTFNWALSSSVLPALLSYRMTQCRQKAKEEGDAADGVLSGSGESAAARSLHLADAIIIGSHSAQAKFSELTIDMYRIMQTLEFEYSAAPSHAASKQPPGSGGSASSNPHKYVLYHPLITSFLLYLATAHRELPEDGVLLIYLSAGRKTPHAAVSVGVPQVDDAASESSTPYLPTIDAEEGKIGLLDSLAHQEERDHDPRSPQESDPNAVVDGTGPNKAAPSNYQVDGLMAGDLMPFTRKPLFVVIDAEANGALRDSGLSNGLFGQPVVLFFSAEKQLPLLDARDPNASGGSLMTMFLHCPPMGIATLLDQSSLTEAQLSAVDVLISDIFVKWDALFMAERAPGATNGTDLAHPWAMFLADPFLRVFVMRFCLLVSLLSHHKDAHDRPERIPVAEPPLPANVLQSESVTSLIASLVALLVEDGGSPFVGVE